MVASRTLIFESGRRGIALAATWLGHQSGICRGQTMVLLPIPSLRPKYILDFDGRILSRDRASFTNVEGIAHVPKTKIRQLLTRAINAGNYAGLSKIMKVR